MNTPTYAKHLLLALVLTAVQAQQPERRSIQEEHRIPILILGTYHFANPNQDLQKTSVDDHMSERRQREIQAVTKLLAKFEPTVIGVERPFGDDDLDRDYDTYVEGSRELRVNEAEQLGMRLAKALGHERVFGIDNHMDLDLDAVMGAAARNGQTRVLETLQDTMARMQSLQQRIEKMPVAEALATMNDPRLLPEGKDVYLRLAVVRDGEAYPGADQVARWYQRNFRMFANIASLAQSPDERVLIVVGLGHCPLLRELAEADPRFRVVDPLDFLNAE